MDQEFPTDSFSRIRLPVRWRHLPPPGQDHNWNWFVPITGRGQCRPRDQSRNFFATGNSTTAAFVRASGSAGRLFSILSARFICSDIDIHHRISSLSYHKGMNASCLGIISLILTLVLSFLYLEDMQYLKNLVNQRN